MYFSLHNQKLCKLCITANKGFKLKLSHVQLKRGNAYSKRLSRVPLLAAL